MTTDPELLKLIDPSDPWYAIMRMSDRAVLAIRTNRMEFTKNIRNAHHFPTAEHAQRVISNLLCHVLAGFKPEEYQPCWNRWLLEPEPES